MGKKSVVDKCQRNVSVVLPVCEEKKGNVMLGWILWDVMSCRENFGMVDGFKGAYQLEL